MVLPEKYSAEKLMRARVYVFTFKAGLLANFAHDLRLSVTSFQIRFAHDQLEATFDASSLRVDGVARRGKVDSDALSKDDKAEIEETIRKELLESAEHRRIQLQGTLKRDGAGYTVDAELNLRGQTQGLRIPIRLERESAVAEVELIPSKFGVPQYKSFMGAISLQDRVRVRVEILEELAKLEARLSSAETSVFEPG